MKLGFELSEYLSLPIMIYSPALLNHSSGLVQLETPDPEREKRIENMKHMGTYRKFIKDPDKFLNAIHWAQKNQNTLFSIIDELKEQKISDKYYEKIISPNTNFRIQVNTENENNRSLPITKKGGEQKRKKSENKRIAFIGEGICWSYLLEIQRCLGIELSALRLKLIYPVSEKLVLSFLQESKAEILVILEEQEDFIENQIKNIIYDLQSQSKISDQPVIIGKSAFPRIGGLSEDIIIDSLAKPLNIEKSRIIIKEFQDILSKKEQIQMIKGIQKELPIREPTFCPGCSHRNVFYALKRASNRYKKETGIQPVYGGDIGCYTMSMSEPYGTMDYLICMGAGVGIANGIGRSMDQEKQHLIAMIGDSTFFHSGIQPIINLAQKNINVLVLILNNYYTAMTGHQDSPSTPATQQPVIEESANHQLVKNNVRFTKHSRRTISIKKILKSLGNFPIKELDGYSIERMKRSFQRLFRIPGLKFALVNAECALHKGRRIKFLKKNLKGKHSEIKVNISDFCTKCDECFEVLGCTAIQESEDKYYIDESRCMGEFCLSCLEVCPNHAIFKTHLNPTEPRIDKIKEQIMDERMSKNN